MEPVSFASSFLSMVSALAVILGLLFGAVYFLKKFFPDSASRFSDNKIINIISARYVNRRTSIMVVEVLGKVVVIGSSENQLSYITEISDEKVLDRLERFKTNNNAPQNRFSMRTNKISDRIKMLLVRRDGKAK
jgi:flagellar biosynthetic protein FliO